MCTEIDFWLKMFIREMEGFFILMALCRRGVFEKKTPPFRDSHKKKRGESEKQTHNTFFVAYFQEA